MADRNALAELLMQQNYGVAPARALRNPLLELSRETYRPWPALPPLAPRQVMERDHSRAEPPRVQREVAQALAEANPIMGGIGLWEMGKGVAQAAGRGDYGGAFEHLAPFLASMAVPMAPKGQRQPAVKSYGRTLPEEILWAFDPYGEGRMWPHPDQWVNEVKPRISPEQIAKAKAAGYNTDQLLFRGSTKSNADPLRRLKEGEKLDPEDVALGLVEREYPYFTDTPRIANAYAAGENYHGMLPSSFNAFAKRGEGSGSNITPAWALRDRVLTIPYKNHRLDRTIAEILLGSEALRGRGFHGLLSMEDIADAAREQNYNMVKFTGMGDLGGIQNQYLPLHVDAIRSPWAKFDPANAKSGNFMAGMAGAAAAPTLVDLLMQEPRNEY